MGGWFGRGWPWVAIVVVVVVIAAMYAMASRYYASIRSAVGLPSMNDKKGEPPPAPVSTEELARLLDTRRPEVLAGDRHRRVRGPRLAHGAEALLGSIGADGPRR